MGLTVLTWGALILVSLAFSVTSLAEEEEVTLGKESSLERCVVRVQFFWCRYKRAARDGRKEVVG